jgi:ketosteroid isomerase-like protein
MMDSMDVENREAIRELLHRYCHYVDAGDADKWAGLYAEDGSFNLGAGRGPIQGRAALREFASRFRAGTGLHLSANPVIAVEGDEASVSSYVVVIGGAEDPKVNLAGRYEDRLRRVGGEWFIGSRCLYPQMRRSS